MPQAGRLDTAGPPTGVHPHGADRPDARTVADVMLTDLKLSPASVTVGELRRLFADDHVHVALIVTNGRLLSVVARTDLRGADRGPAVHLGRRRSRIVAPGADLNQTWRTMRVSRSRRLAVVTSDGTLRGLLCLKRDGTGFCSDRGVGARASAGREGTAPISLSQETPAGITRQNDFAP